MSEKVGLFSSVKLGELELPNRIMVSPMCQYSAIDGTAQHWHTVHLGNLAISGAGILFLEATAVSEEGRITPGCLGLYSNDNHAALRSLLESLRAISVIPIAIQLAHAGRKASSEPPWRRGSLISSADGGWNTLAPSALPHRQGEAAPVAMTESDIQKVIDDFANSAGRARDLGFEAVEIHMAHGYLLHQFLSPIANQRTDDYGGSLDNRMRLPLQVFDAVQSKLDSSTALGVRLSATDWVENGWDIDQSIMLSQALESRGCDFIDASSGGVASQQKIKLGPGYQVDFATAIKQSIALPVIAVGLITEPQQAQDIIVQQKADVVALARAFLSNPRWPWLAAAELGGTINAPKQYWRSVPADTPAIFGDLTFGQR